MSSYFDRYKLLQEFEDVLSGYLEEIIKKDKKNPNDSDFLDYVKSRLESENFSVGRKKGIEEGLKKITNISNYKKYDRLMHVYNNNVVGNVTSTNPAVQQLNRDVQAAKTRRNSIPIKTIETRYDLDRMGQDSAVKMDLTQFRTAEELQKALKAKGLHDDTIAGLFIKYTIPNEPTQEQPNSNQNTNERNSTPTSGRTPSTPPKGDKKEETPPGGTGDKQTAPKPKDWFTFGNDGENKFNPLNWGHGTQALGAILLAAGAYALYKKYKKGKEKGQSDQEFLQKNPQAQRYVENNKQ